MCLFDDGVGYDLFDDNEKVRERERERERDREKRETRVRESVCAIVVLIYSNSFIHPSISFLSLSLFHR